MAQISFEGGRVRIDEVRREVLRDGAALPIGGRRFDLLLALLQRRDRVAGRAELMQAVWPARVVEDNNLEVHVAALRAALGRDAIVTVRGRGYRWAWQPDGHTARAPADGGLLFGREAWLEQAAVHVLPGGPSLVTLHGAGGVGKTRLALALAERHGGEHADGTCTVRLAAVQQVEQVPFAVAAALGLQPVGTRSMALHVTTYLAERQLLLVLDNAEHLLPGLNGVLEAWRSAAPRLRLLVTSRLPLGLMGEHVVLVPPLALPRQGSEAPELQQSPAVQLLLARAQSLDQNSSVQGAELAAAAEICRRLDGLPLALELVAARLRVLSPRALLARLNKGASDGAGAVAPFLAADTQTEPRQRSLARSVAWSVALLPEPASRLFDHLGVFVDGCSLEAAAEVCGLDSSAALQAMGALLEVFLVQRSDCADGEPHYRMLEPVREVALQRLLRDPWGELALDRHAAWYQALVQAQSPRLSGRERAAALVRLRPELPNIRAALRRLIHHPGRGPGDALAALHMTAALTWAWYFGGSLLEGRAWLHAALQMPGAADHPAAQARAQIGAAHLSMYLFDIQDALQQAAAALATARTLGDDRLLAEALFVLAVPTLAHDPPAAIPLWHESMERYRACADAWGLALATTCLGIPFAMAPGQETQAEALLTEGRRLFAELGDEWGTSLHDHYMSVIRLRGGDLARARQLCLSMLGTAQALDDGLRVGGALHQLACIERAAADLPHALQRLHDAAARHHAQGRGAYTGVLLHQGAAWWAAAGAAEDDPRAAALFGAASVDRGLALPIWITPEQAQAAAMAESALRQRLGNEAFERAWREGRSWSTAQAVAALLPADALS